MKSTVEVKRANSNTVQLSSSCNNSI